MKKQGNLVSAITISGKLTIAHYLAVLKPLLTLKSRFNLFLSIADLHAITTKHTPKHLLKLRMQTSAYLFACGFAPEEVFIQSQIHGHTEIAFILGCHINIGTLMRMTQFKSKANQNACSLALLSYPLLMASDILLYDADVLVGNDQKQHIELTRNLAEKLNNKFCKNLFHPPHLVDTAALNYRIRDLQTPKNKMSKSSAETKGIIFLDDDPQTARNKIIAAKTDSENKINFDFVNQPGLSNLILIYALIRDISLVKATTILQNECANYLVLKEKVANAVVNLLHLIQKNANYYQENLSLVEKYLSLGKVRAQQQVNAKLKNIEADLGFVF